jgi:hypothetical protein
MITSVPVILISCNLLEQVKQKYAYGILKGNPEGNKPLGRTKHKWMDNIKTGPRELEWGGMDWNHLAMDKDQ